MARRPHVVPLHAAGPVFLWLLHIPRHGHHRGPDSPCRQGRVRNHHSQRATVQTKCSTERRDHKHDEVAIQMIDILFYVCRFTFDLVLVLER